MMDLAPNKKNMPDFLLKCIVKPQALIFKFLFFFIFFFFFSLWPFCFNYLVFFFSIGPAKWKRDEKCSISPFKWPLHKGMTEEIDFHFSSIFLNCNTYFTVKEDASPWIFLSAFLKQSALKATNMEVSA